MTDQTLLHFRGIAEAMETEPADWQWVGPHGMMFGITEKRARDLAEKHGGVARPKPDAGDQAAIALLQRFRQKAFQGVLEWDDACRAHGGVGEKAHEARLKRIASFAAYRKLCNSARAIGGV